MEDLSHLTSKSLAGAGSMSATNTVSVPADFTPPGTASESVSPDDVRDESDHLPGPSGDYRRLDRGEGGGTVAARWTGTGSRPWR